MSSIFNQLLNVKGTVVEDVRIVDSPLRPEPVLEVRVRPREPAARFRPRHGGDHDAAPRAVHARHGGDQFDAPAAPKSWPR